MRLKLTLQHSPNQALPINYQYLISSWVYHTLAKADEKYATFLHKHGYNFGGKNYKLFTFSPLYPCRYRIDAARGNFILAESPTELVLSFYLDDAMQHFVIGLFRDQRMRLGKVDFGISAIETLPKPLFQKTMRFRLITPLCISRNEEDKKYAQYLHPDAEGYGELLFHNLLHKGSAAVQILFPAVELESHPEYEFSYQILSTPKSRLLDIKGTKVRGYVFDFEMTGPKKLLEVGWFAGFGEKNSSLGMGMAVVKN